jgi:hypothetical protein
MAARASGPPGGAQVITTFNGGNVVSTQVPSLNFDGQNAGDLIKTITGLQPNMVNGVTLDNTYVGHQQYRYLPYPVNARTMTFQWTTPNWCHFRDISLNLQLIFRMPRGAITQFNLSPVNATSQKIRAGLYHITTGGILSIFQNMRVKLGAQVDIFTAFEKTKPAYHILNTWMRGKWDQKAIFALIDRWDAWYGCSAVNAMNPNRLVTNASAQGYPYLMQDTPNSVIPTRQSDNPYERLLSQILAQRGLLSVTDNAATESTIVVMPVNDTRTNQIVENISISFDKLHSLFQQNAMLPPGTQIIMEIDLPMYSDFDFSVVTMNPSNALWANIGWVAPPCDCNGNGTAINPNTDDLTFQTAQYWDTQNSILCAVNQTSMWNSIVMNCVNLKPEIARSLQDERIKRPLVYNYHQQIATTVGNWFDGQSVYNFTLPPNQAIPTQFLFGWINTSIQAYRTGETYPGSGFATLGANTKLATSTVTNSNLVLTNALAKDGPNAFQNFSAGTVSTFDGFFYGSSLTPLPVQYKRAIVRRGGFQEIYQYGNYYDGNGIYKYGVATTASTPGTTVALIQNAISLFGVKNLSPDPSQNYFDHLEEYQFDRKSVNGLGPIERKMKYSYTPQWLTEGKWSVFQLNPCKHDTGQYSSDQNAYTVDVQLEVDLDLPNLSKWMGLSNNSKLVCVRIMPAQLSYAIDGTVRIYTWPNLLISPNAVVSGNPPPAGPGGSI